MPLPDICIGGGGDAGGGGIGLPVGPGGGIDGGTIVPGTPDTGVTYPGKIGDKPCSRPVIATITDAKRKFTIQINRSTGSPLDLSSVSKVMFYAKETYDAAKLYVKKECAVVDAVEGIIELSFNKGDTPYSGVWWAAFQLLNENDSLLSQYDVYLYVEKSLTSTARKNNTITIAEVRMALLDRCPDDNPLLGEVEFSDAEVAFAIRRPVDEWNERPPRISTHQYTTATFPYRYYWTEAACGELMRAAARNLIRNKLNYSAGGISVDDKSRAPVYTQLAGQLHQQYLEWMMMEKARLNAESVYGGVGSVTYW